MGRGRFTLPNLITIGRILACPAVFFLILTPSVSPRESACSAAARNR